MLNATSVGDGRQIVIAPFRSGGGIYDIGYLYDQPELPVEKDVTLGTAVGLSGRFPWVLPPALVGDAGLALVDGAYFESSGIEALRTVRAALRPYEVKPTGSPLFPYVKVYVIVIGGLRSVQGQGQSASANQSPSMDEVTPPLRTLLNARDRRGYMADNTLRDWDSDIECPPERPEASIDRAGKPPCFADGASALPAGLHVLQPAAGLAALQGHGRDRGPACSGPLPGWRRQGSHRRQGIQ